VTKERVGRRKVVRIRVEALREARSLIDRYEDLWRERIGQGRTRMSIESVFPDTEAMEQNLAMGMEEGLTQAVGQIDAILAEEPA